MSIIRPLAMWPVVINATNNVVPITFNGTDYSPTLANETILSPYVLASRIDTALEGLALGGTWSPGFSAQGRWTFTHSTTNFTFRFGTASNTIAPVIGFALANTSGAARTYTGANPMPNAWFPQVPVYSDTKIVRERPLDIVTVAENGRYKTIRDAEFTTRTVTFRYLTPDATFIAREINSVPSLERWWQAGSTGSAIQFNYFRDINSSTFQSYTFAPETLRRFEPKRMKTQRELYEATLSFIGYV